jgi:hypothetical protein
LIVTWCLSLLILIWLFHFLSEPNVLVPCSLMKVLRWGKKFLPGDILVLMEHLSPFHKREDRCR